MHPGVEAKAASVLAAYLAGEAYPRKCKHRRSFYLCFSLGYRHRLLCMNPERSKEPDAWQLLTHSAYNTIVQMKH